MPDPSRGEVETKIENDADGDSSSKAHRRDGVAVIAGEQQR